jgi:hypothetical protein
MTLNNDFHTVKRHKRHISNSTLQTAKKSTKPVPTSTALKLPLKAVLTCNFFAPTRTTDMDTKSTGAGGSQKTMQTATNSDDFYYKPHSTPRRLTRPCQRRVQVPKYMRRNPYHNKIKRGVDLKQNIRPLKSYFFSTVNNMIHRDAVPRKDVDLREIIRLLFKSMAFHKPATEIIASLTSHTPIPRKLIPTTIPFPDYSGLKVDKLDQQISKNPRLCQPNSLYNEKYMSKFSCMHSSNNGKVV